MVGKLHEPVESEAMSGFSCSMPPRSEPLPERPPVENWMIMPGAVLAHPLLHLGEQRGIAEVGVSSGLRTWICTRVAPASNASWVHFDLLGERDRHGRIVLLARHRAGDRDGDDDTILIVQFNPPCPPRRLLNIQKHGLLARPACECRSGRRTPPAVPARCGEQGARAAARHRGLARVVLRSAARLVGEIDAGEGLQQHAAHEAR